jgi:hypothetical protein
VVSSFFGELGKKLAEKWLSLVVLPGLLLVAEVLVAAELGHAHAVDLRLLTSRLTELGRRLSMQPATTIGLLVVAVLLLSAAAGLARQGASVLVQRVWLGLWPVWSTPLASRLVEKRRIRWRRAHRAYEEALMQERAAPPADVPSSAEFAAARNRIALTEPARPTWIGDRVHALDRRVKAEYGLDLATAWPRLWLVVPEVARAELRIARGSFDDAASLAGWSVLQLLLGLAWWPAVLIGLGVGTTSWWRSRLAIATLADLAEAVVDLYGRELAPLLGIATPDGRLTPDIGQTITRYLRKGA